MNFLELLKNLESHLGYHQIPLNPSATTLKNIFESSPIHYDFIQRLAQSIYHANHCQRLSDIVEREATFEALAPLRLEALQSKRTDVDLFHFLEELCVALDQCFDPIPTDPMPETTEPTQGQVIELARFRRLKSSA